MLISFHFSSGHYLSYSVKNEIPSKTSPLEIQISHCGVIQQMNLQLQHSYAETYSRENKLKQNVIYTAVVTYRNPLLV